MLSQILSKLRDKKGVTAAEYAILAVGVVIVVGGAVATFGSALQNAFTGIGEQINSTRDTIGS